MTSSDPRSVSKSSTKSLLLISALSLSATLLIACSAMQSSRNVNPPPKVTKPSVPIAPSVQAPEPKLAETEQHMMRMREVPQAHKIVVTGSRIAGGPVNREIEFIPAQKNETYLPISANPIHQVAEAPVSTFSVDVDTGGYTNIRRMLREGELPPHDQVRVEEIINYFSYEYTKPASIEKPFVIESAITQSPWNSNKHLLHIAIQGYEDDADNLPPANWVFLVDVSGSMNDPSKLPLAKQSLKLLTKKLRAEDRISLVTYADGTRVVLPSTSGSETSKINHAIDQLYASGSTAGESGLKLAYQQAESGKIDNGNNRIVMLTDGDFNVGMSSVDEMIRLVKQKRDTGIYLSTVGFGTGNYREDMMEQMADNGNGSYFYIDSYQEAYRTFERNLRSNLFAIAKDVKIQIEFNPTEVSEYRLVGYENRALNREDFNNDKVDAGDVGQGHKVTAIYELTLTGGQASVDPLRYQNNQNTPKPVYVGHADELAYIKLRYKPVNSETSQLIESVVPRELLSVRDISDSKKLAIAAAGFGELLRDSPYLSTDFNYDQLSNLIASVSFDPEGEKSELGALVRMAESLK